MGDCASCPSLADTASARNARVGSAASDRLRVAAAQHPHLALLGVVCVALATEPAVQAGRDAASTLEYAGAAVGLVGRVTDRARGRAHRVGGPEAPSARSGTRLRAAPRSRLARPASADRSRTGSGPHVLRRGRRRGARRDVSEVRVSDGRGRALRSRDVARGRAAACAPRGDDARLPARRGRGDLVGRNAVERVARGVRRRVAAEPVPLGAPLRPRADGLPGRRARPRPPAAVGARGGRPRHRRCAQVVARARAPSARRLAPRTARRALGSCRWRPASPWRSRR